MKDTQTKLTELLDRLEESLQGASQVGANPMQIAMAMALPFARQLLRDTPPDVLDSMVDQLLGGYAALRADEAPGVIILRCIDVPDGAPNIRYIEPLFDSVFTLDDFIAGTEGGLTVRLGEPISVPGLTDWA